MMARKPSTLLVLLSLSFPIIGSAEFKKPQIAHGKTKGVYRFEHSHTDNALVVQKQAEKTGSFSLSLGFRRPHAFSIDEISNKLSKIFESRALKNFFELHPETQISVEKIYTHIHEVTLNVQSPSDSKADLISTLKKFPQILFVSSPLTIRVQ